MVRRLSPGSAVAPLVAAALLAALLLVAGAGSAEATRLFVPRQHRTLQAAIDAAAPGDTVWVAAGVHRGPFTLKKKLVLFGDGGPDSTILDGGDSVRVLLVEDVRGGALIGFGIRGGKASSGGGIQCLRDTSFAIQDCHFTKNWESAIGVWRSSGVSVIGCRFIENQGSAIRWDASNGAVVGSEFRDNRGHDGGAMALRASRLIMPVRGCLFAGNRAEGSVGGAIALSDTSSIEVGACTFRENSSAVAGGAIAAMTGSAAAVSRSVFERNRAASSGALHSDHASINVVHTVFDRNSATAGGAAIGVLGRRTANLNPTFRYSTFHRNETDGDGGTLFLVDVSPELRKNIFVVTKDQRAVLGMKSSPLYDCNLIWDPTGGATGALPSANTLVGDPMFCDAEKGDFKLRDLSPAMRAPCGPIGALPERAGCTTFRVQPAR